MAMTRRQLIAAGLATLAGSALQAGERAVSFGQWSRRRGASGTSFAPDVELSLIAEPGEVEILPGAPTRVWRFSGSVLRGPASGLQPSPGGYLGPTLRLRRGQRVRIRFSNRLPDRSIVHWHGLDVPAAADGHPRLAVPAGGEYVYEFEVTNRAGTYWYHPHPHMQTAAQIYRGLAGVLIVADEDEEALALPDGADELLCVLQDRHFDARNQLAYAPAMMDTMTGLLGERILVNGHPSARWVLGSRPYRVRLLNASNARIFKLEWSDGTPMVVIATDGGLLERPLTRHALTLAPAQRAELWLDLTGRERGSSLELRTASFDVADAGLRMGRGMGAMRGRGMGMGGSVGGSLPLGAPISLVTIDVGGGTATTARKLPTRLGTFVAPQMPPDAVPARRIPLTGMAMQWTLGAGAFALTEVGEGETVAAGSTHRWEFVNAGTMGMQMGHPVHLHGRQFRVVSRSGGDAGNSLRDGLVDDGWMDTVLVLPGETVGIEVTFTRHPGLYLYHCHILEHEDMGMMRNFQVVSG